MLDASRNIGNKFHEDGSVRFFPGNTIISLVDHKAPVWAAQKKSLSLFPLLPHLFAMK